MSLPVIPHLRYAEDAQRITLVAAKDRRQYVFAELLQCKL